MESSVSPGLLLSFIGWKREDTSIADWRFQGRWKITGVSEGVNLCLAHFIWKRVKIQN